MDRKAHWEKVYDEKSPLEVSWYQKEPTLSLRLIEATGLSADAPIIDVGGGASLLVDRLLERGFSRLAVLDIAAQALRHAKERLGDRAYSVEWFEQDVTAFRPPHPYQLWHDRAVFHFLTDADDRRRYVGALNRSLAPGAHLIIAAFGIGGPDKCSGLDIVQYDADKLMGELGDGFELLEETGENHRTPAGKEQKFAFFRLRKTV